MKIKENPRKSQENHKEITEIQWNHMKIIEKQRKSQQKSVKFIDT